MVLYCGGGYRSALVAEALGKMGYRNAISLDGGWRAWNEAGLPVEKEEKSSSSKASRSAKGDLVKEYVRLNLTKEPFARVPIGRYINFMSDFLARERGATWEQARRAWKKLKKLDVPKDYRSWMRLHSSKRG
jgi:rhodanese-like protein